MALIKRSDCGTEMQGILFRTIRALLLDMQPISALVGYHSNPDNKRAFSYDGHQEYKVSFEDDEYFVRLNSTADMDQFEILIGHTRKRVRSGNTPDITFTEQHFSRHLLLVVAPSLKRCGGSLSDEPRAIGDFPARVFGTKNRFAIGFADAGLFPRLFRLCAAKLRSINSR